MTSKKAFTLVELSIVLIIIGLLVAGVTTGSQLVDNAKKLKIAREVDGVRTSIVSFVTIFDKLPGDFDGAVDEWGAYAAGPPITGAINGNGDDIFAGSDYGELLGIWHHLQLAGLLDSKIASFTISRAKINSSGTLSGGTDLPKSKGAWGGSYFFDLEDSELTLKLGSDAAGSIPTNNITVGSEALIFDKKYDDGECTAGTIRASASSCTCNNNYCPGSGVHFWFKNMAPNL